jgi:hypothetical protein
MRTKASCFDVNLQSNINNKVSLFDKITTKKVKNYLRFDHGHHNLLISIQMIIKGIDVLECVEYKLKRILSSEISAFAMLYKSSFSIDHLVLSTTSRGNIDILKIQNDFCHFGVLIPLPD